MEERERLWTAEIRFGTLASRRVYEVDHRQDLVRARLVDERHLIRRSMEHVRSVRRSPYRQVSVLPDVRHSWHGPVPSGQSVRKL